MSNLADICGKNKSKVIFHRHFNVAMEKTLREIQFGIDGEIQMVIAPSGVGKTTLCHFLAQYIQKQQTKGWRTDCGPPVIVECPAPNKGAFSITTLMEDILFSLGEIKISKKRDFDREVKWLQENGKLKYFRRISADDMERILINRIKLMKPCVVFIDECQLLASGLGRVTLIGNLNRIKRWTNLNNTKIILLGTHEAKRLLNLNEQLSRRINVVYFPRYQQNETEMAEFAQIYRTLIKFLPIEIDKSCHSDFLYIYNHTLGCIGLLNSWLRRSYGYCLDKKLCSIKKDILDLHRFPYQSLEVAEQEIREFEQYSLYNQREYSPGLPQIDFSESVPKTMVRNSSNPRKGITKKPTRYNVP